MASSTFNRKSFSVTALPRARWNVLDMITLVAGKAARAYLLDDIDMTWAEATRKSLARAGHHITVTAMLLKTIAIAQRTHAESRMGFLPFGRRVCFQNIVAGFTVERNVADQAAVFFGTIQNPDEKPLQQISDELASYGQLPLNEVPRLLKEDRFSRLPWLLRRFILWLGLQVPLARLLVNDATFGLTSLGKFGISNLMGPCACTSTFGVGTVETIPTVKNGLVVSSPMMGLSLNFDLRVLEMTQAASFFNEVRRLLEGGLEEYLVEEYP